MLKKSFKTTHGYLCLKANMKIYLKMPKNVWAKNDLYVQCNKDRIIPFEISTKSEYK